MSGSPISLYVICAFITLYVLRLSLYLCGLRGVMLYVILDKIIKKSIANRCEIMYI